LQTESCGVGAFPFLKNKISVRYFYHAGYDMPAIVKLAMGKVFYDSMPVFYCFNAI
jgi:hypothetical protein